MASSLCCASARTAAALVYRQSSLGSCVVVAPGAELIGGFPQAGFNLRDVVAGGDGYLCGADCCCGRFAEGRWGWVASAGVNGYVQLWFVLLGRFGETDGGLPVKTFCS
jgi:hypothetical protein